MLLKIPARRYRHTKTGSIYYRAFDNARIESEGFDGELQSVYVSEETGQPWIRPTEEFEEMVTSETGEQFLRFVMEDPVTAGGPVAPEPEETDSQGRWRGQDRRQG